ncbi:unnamed protein product, partial [Polarella glacialis]
VCAVLVCLSPDISCLQFPGPDGGVRGIELHMTGVSRGAAVPEVLARGETLLTPGARTDGFTFVPAANKTSSVLSASSSTSLASVIIYHRPVDTEPLPYSCPSGPKVLFV